MLKCNKRIFMKYKCVLNYTVEIVNPLYRHTNINIVFLKRLEAEFIQVFGTSTFWCAYFLMCLSSLIWPLNDVCKYKTSCSSPEISVEPSIMKEVCVTHHHLGFATFGSCIRRQEILGSFTVHICLTYFNTLSFIILI